MNSLEAGLLIFILVRESIYQYTTHRLVNKIMSRNYHEYESAKEVYKPKERAIIDQGIPEDLGHLNESPLV